MSQAAIQLRMFDPAQDYDMVCAWWTGHGWNPVPQAFLPKLGVIACWAEGDKTEDTAAAWLYMDNSSPVCWLEYMVSNPKANAGRAVKALRHLDSFLTGEAKATGYHAMMTTCRQDSLVKFHQKNGFTKTDEDVTHLVKILN
jgi:hypothetical protein